MKRNHDFKDSQLNHMLCKCPVKAPLSDSKKYAIILICCAIGVLVTYFAGDIRWEVLL